jgi:hypothetical protein
MTYIAVSPHTAVSERPPSLRAATDRVHCGVEQALDARDRSILDAVWWLSTHLAATARVVHPVACRVLPAGRQQEARRRASARSVLQLLWALDRSLTGDGRSIRRSPDSLLTQLRPLLRESAAAERELLSELEAVLSPQELETLYVRYRRAVQHGPTRPHPLAPTGGRLHALMCRLEGDIDRLRDAMDNRHIPIQRDRRPRITSPWGQYLLGTVEPGVASALTAQSARAARSA